MEKMFFRKAYPLEDPLSCFRGFNPGTAVYPKGYQKGPEYRPLEADMILERDVPVTLRDGVTVRVDIYRPNVETKVPAILCSSIFGKNSAYNNYTRIAGFVGRDDNCMVNKAWVTGFDEFEAPDPGFFSAHEYAVIYLDTRGVGSSEGDAHYFGTQDATDNYDVIEYLAVQDWCSGRVTMAGNSWLGITQWYTAALKPPHLTCIAPWEGHGNMYRDEYMRGGIPHPSIVRENMCYGKQNMEDLHAGMAAYPLYSEYWEEKAADFEKVECPAYVVASYSSQVHCNGTFEGFRKISSKEKWLRIHNQQEWQDLQRDENKYDLLKFYDYYLKDKRDNGWDQTPPVRLCVLDISHEDVLGRPEETYPLERQTFEKLYLDPVAERLQAEQIPMTRHVSYPSEDAKSRLKFIHVFDKDTEVVGYCKLHLFVSAEARDMDVYAKIQKMDKNGQYVFNDALEMQYGGPNAMLRVSLRDSDEALSTDSEPRPSFKSPRFLHKGEIVCLEMPFYPTGLKFHAGEKLELTVAGFDYLGLNPGINNVLDGCNRGMHTVHCGGIYDSYLQIPVIPTEV